MIMLFLVLILILNLFFYLEKGISALLSWVAAKYTASIYCPFQKISDWSLEKKASRTFHGYIWYFK